MAGASSQVQVTYDGTPIAALSITLDLGSTAVGRLILGDNTSGRTYQMALDDVQASSSGSESTPPTTPANLLAGAPDAGHVELTWDPSTDASGVTGYDLFRDGGLLAHLGPTTTTFIDSTVGVGLTYSYQVQSRDGAGNVSALSAAASATIPVDGQPALCSYAPISHLVWVTLSLQGAVAPLGVSGGSITMNGANCGGAKVSNTDLITVQDLSASNDTSLSIDQSGGSLAPGFTDEPGAPMRSRSPWTWAQAAPMPSRSPARPRASRSPWAPAG